MKKLAFIAWILLSTTIVYAKKIKIDIITMETTMGIIKLKLYNETPKHATNFLKLCNEHFFDSLLFHRVIPGFMIQGGDPQSKNAAASTMLGNGDVGYKIDAEFVESRHHKYGVLAAARDNNPEKASSGCQFYIVVGKKMTDAELETIEKRTNKKYTEQQRNDYKTIGGTPFLDMGYTVFGEVTEGMDVVEKIATVERDGYDRPKTDVRILHVSVKKTKVKVD